MDKEIIGNHRAISATFERFLNYAGAEEGGLGHMQLLDSDLPGLLRHYDYPLHAWPWFISSETRAMLASCVQRVPALIERAIRLEFEGRPQELARFFVVPEIIATLFLDGMTDTKYLLQRTDAILTKRGLKILEINMGSTIGGWQIQWMDKQYRKQPELAAFFEAVPCVSRDIPYGFMEFLISAVVDKKLEVDGEINVLYIVKTNFCQTDGPVEATKLFNQVLRDRKLRGMIHFQATQDDVDLTAEGVFWNGIRMSVVLCGSAGEMPAAFFRACFARQVWTTDGPFEHILADKRSLALAYRHKDNAAFNAEERGLIEQFVPWGVPLQEGEVGLYGERVDLRTLLLERKDEFVVKIAQGMSGNDVFIGKFTVAEEWRAVVERGLSENGWLVQEYCTSLPFYGQTNGAAVGEFDVVWGVFGFGQQYGGCWLRLMDRDRHTGVINSAKGAEEAIVYEAAD